MTIRGQVRHSFPAWKVYIYGVDVTEDVTSVTNNWGDHRSPNVSQITLSSLKDKYVCNEADIRALYDDILLDVEDIETLKDLVYGLENAEGMQDAQDRIDGLVADRLRRNFRATDSDILVNGVYHKKIQQSITVNAKRDVLLSKYNVRSKKRVQPSIADGLDEAVRTALQAARSGRTSLGKLSSLSGDFLRYPFQVGQSIFHTRDAVRIWFRDPFDMNSWYWGMTGTVAHLGESLQSNGNATVTITVTDMLRSYHLARVSTNWALFDIDVLEDPERDTLFRSWFSEQGGLTNLTLPEIMYFFTFGNDLAGPAVQEALLTSDKTGANGLAANISGLAGIAGIGDLVKEVFKGALAKPVVRSFPYEYRGVNGLRTSRIPENGVGCFNYETSEVYVLGGSAILEESTGFLGPRQSVVNRVGSKEFKRIDSLEQWQSAIDHKFSTRVEDLLELALPASRAECEGRLRKLQNARGFLEPYDAMREIGENPHLYPVEGGRLMMLIPASLGPGTNRDILLRDLVAGIADRTEFITKLQIMFNVCERINFSFYCTPRGDVVCEMPLYSFRPEDFGRYAERYVFTRRDTESFESDFQEDKVRTQFRMPYHIVSGLKGIGTSDQIWQTPGTVTMRSLVPMFGVRMESGNPEGFIDNHAAATYYAYTKLSQINADAWALEVNTTIRMGIGPNRPLYFGVRDCIATTRRGSESITWGRRGSVTQKLNVNYRRGWAGNVTATGRKVYESFGGKASEPIDYSLFFSFDSNMSDMENSTKELTSSGTKRTDKTLDAMLGNLVGITGQSDKKLLPNAADAFNQMKQAAFQDGIKLTVVSAHRSYKEQSDLHAKWKRDPLNNFPANRAGTSDHEVGTAVDIALGFKKNDPRLATSPILTWLRTNAGRFGFAWTYGFGDPVHFDYIGK